MALRGRNDQNASSQEKNAHTEHLLKIKEVKRMLRFKLIKHSWFFSQINIFILWVIEDNSYQKVLAQLIESLRKKRLDSCFTMASNLDPWTFTKKIKQNLMSQTLFRSWPKYGKRFLTNSHPIVTSWVCPLFGLALRSTNVANLSCASFNIQTGLSQFTFSGSLLLRNTHFCPRHSFIEEARNPQRAHYSWRDVNLIFSRWRLLQAKMKNY